MTYGEIFGRAFEIVTHVDLRPCALARFAFFDDVLCDVTTTVVSDRCPRQRHGALGDVSRLEVLWRTGSAWMSAAMVLRDVVRELITYMYMYMFSSQIPTTS